MITLSKCNQSYLIYIQIRNLKCFESNYYSKLYNLDCSLIIIDNLFSLSKNPFLYVVFNLWWSSLKCLFIISTARSSSPVSQHDCFPLITSHCSQDIDLCTVSTPAHLCLHHSESHCISVSTWSVTVTNTMWPTVVFLPHNSAGNSNQSPLLLDNKDFTTFSQSKFPLLLVSLKITVTCKFSIIFHS